MIKINIGQGQRPEEGFVGCDQFKWDGNIEHVFDLRERFPFEDNSIEEVRARQILEHFAPGDDLFNVLNEIYRVLVKGGMLEAWVPYALESQYTFLPDHLSFWTPLFVTALTTDYQKRGNMKWKVDLVERVIHEGEKNIDVHFKLKKL